MEPRTIKDQKPDTQYLQKLIDEYEKSKDFAKKATDRVDELKEALRGYVKKYGATDDRGHVWLPANTHQLKNEKRVSRSLNEHAAQNWAKAEGHWDTVKKVVEVLDVDALMALVWKNPELEPIIEGFYEEKTSWAFKVVEGKTYDDE